MDEQASGLVWGECLEAWLIVEQWLEGPRHRTIKLLQQDAPGRTEHSTEATDFVE